MKLKILLLSLVCVGAFVSHAAGASVKVINNDHQNYNLEMICGNLHQDFIVEAWDDIVIPLQGDHVSGQEETVCTLTIMETRDYIELENLDVYYIDAGSIYEQ